jgi:hypothetical protein
LKNNNPFNILADDDDDDATVVASNCSPRVPPPSLPPRNLQGNPPARQPTRPLANQPTSLLPTLYTSCPPTTPPTRGWPSQQASKPSHPRHPTPASMTYTPIQLGSSAKHQLEPSNQPTHCPLLNLMTNKIRCPP